MNEKTRKPVMLIVLDGWGVAPPGPSNAISLAETPVMDGLTESRPNTVIGAHGKVVGLPVGQMGNSEVGHLNLGAGRVVKQELVRIDEAVEEGSFAQNEVFKNAAKQIKKSGGIAHIMGLCSPGGVHSSLTHLYALVDFLAGQGIEVRLHAITDGRDTPPSSAREYMVDIERNIDGKAQVAIVVGRYWSMDRDKRWDRVKRGYDAHVQSVGVNHSFADEAFAAAYAEGQTDEFIEPRIIVDSNGSPKGQIKDGDGVFFFNFRADRAREITEALTFKDFEQFDREVVPNLASYVCMTEYRSDFGLPIAFAPHSLKNILGEVLKEAGLRQFRCAETEKYAHVTFFFNGGVEKPFAGEDRELIPSPKEVATYDLKPRMSAAKVGAAVVKRLGSEEDDFVLVNFANPDMVGHTGVLEAAVEAAGVVDGQVGSLVNAMLSKGGAVLITADHGNSEQMIDPNTGEPHTAHTLNPVPLILVDDSRTTAKLREGGSLRDVAPTVLEILGLPAPKEMDGSSLLKD